MINSSSKPDTKQMLVELDGTKKGILIELILGHFCILSSKLNMNSTRAEIRLHVF